MAQNPDIAMLKSEDLLKLTADIVSAYVSNNPLPVAEVPAMIKSVHGTLRWFDRRTPQSEPVDRAKTCGAGQALGHAGLHRLPGRRQKTEDAEALSAFQLQYDAGRIPLEMGIAGRLSDGRTELRRAAFGIRQEDRSGPRRILLADGGAKG